MRQDWKQLTIGDVCEVVNGGTPKTNVVEFWGGPHMWITPAEMGKRTSPYVSDTERHLTDAGLNSTNLLPPYSVILSSRAPIGHLVINTVPMGTNQGCKGLVPKSTLDEKYLYYYLSSIVDLLNELGTGTTFKELSGSNLKRVPIPIPPLNEQRRIVAILDEAFAAIATATANAEKKLASINSMHSNQLACRFLKIQSASKPRQLSTLVTRLTNGYVGQTRNIYLDGGVPYLLARHVRNNRLEFDKRTFVSEGFNEKNRKSKLKAGDVLLVQSGHIGHSAVVPEEHSGHNCHAMIVITPKEGVLDGDYLSLFFQSPMMKRKFEEIRSGSTVPHLTCGLVRELQIPLPDIDSQKALVKELANFTAHCDEISVATREKIALFYDLKMGLLTRAFTGELPSRSQIEVAAE